MSCELGCPREFRPDKRLGRLVALRPRNNEYVVDVGERLPYGLAQHATAALDAWADLREGGKSLRLLLTAWSLRLDERDRARTEETRQRIGEAKAWIDSLAPLGELRLTARRMGKDLLIEVAAGERL